MAECHPTPVPEGQKVCGSCRSCKPVALFYKDANRPDGLYRRCKACHYVSAKKYDQKHKVENAARMRERRARDPERARAISVASQKRAYERDPEKYRARAREWRISHPERAKEIAAATRNRRKDKLAEYLVEYYERNKETIKHRTREREARLREELRPEATARARKRHALKMRAIPPWADLDAIKAVYQRAAAVSIETGVPHQVDHIVPLQSKRVCGLHVEANLQVITGMENQSKSNRWWPDMP